MIKTPCIKGPGNILQPEQPEEKSGKIILNFIHQMNGESIQFDTLKYINAAGNPYLVNEIQYNISDITLYNHNGSEILIDDWKDIHYVDTDIPASQSWEVFDKIPEGRASPEWSFEFSAAPYSTRPLS